MREPTVAVAAPPTAVIVKIAAFGMVLCSVVHLFHVIQFRAEATMHTEDLLLNDSSYRQAVEAICECLPQLYIVPPFACSIDSMNIKQCIACMQR
jgi:hypothetical protein